MIHVGYIRGYVSVEPYTCVPYLRARLDARWDDALGASLAALGALARRAGALGAAAATAAPLPPRLPRSLASETRNR